MKNRNAPKETFLEIRNEDGQGRLHLKGDWVIDHSAEILPELEKIDLRSVASINARDVGRMDMWGSLRLKTLLAKRDVPVDLNDNQKKIFDFISKDTAKNPEKPKKSGLRSGFEALGKMAVSGWQTTYGLLSFIGEIGVCFARNLRRPSAFRFHSVIRHIDETGFRALPIIGLLSVLVTMVISYQAATQLQKFGANIFTIDLTVISLLREMGVLITAIMVAGRSGSAFAAEIGVMKMREEIDALKTMGFNPVELLVMPRLLAMMLTLPILAFLADIIGLAGGSFISILLLDIPLDQYIDRVSKVATPTMFFIGLIKAPVFAFVITVIGTYQGMNVTGSAESVGKLTTVAVVQSIFLVIMVDALFSVLFANMGL